MEIVENEADLRSYMRTAVKASPDHPVLVDSYIVGQECEVDAISDGQNILILVSWSISNALVSTQVTPWRFILLKPCRKSARNDCRLQPTSCNWPQLSWDDEYSVCYQG